MANRRILIGTVNLDRDTEMFNNAYEYAASFENVLVPAGTYPVYCYSSDIKPRGERLVLDGGYLGYEGTLLSGNVGGKPGDHTDYHPRAYNFMLAEWFFNGYVHIYEQPYTTKVFELRPEWRLDLADFFSAFDNRRVFTMDLVLDGEPTYMDEED